MKRIRLQIGIAAAFTTALVPLMVAIIGYLYLTNTELALDTASKSMEQASQDISDSVGVMLNSVSRVVDATATFGKIDSAQMRNADGMLLLHKEIEKLPQVYSLYMGFVSDGGFYEVFRLPANISKFGVYGQPPPAGSRFAMRMLDAKSGSLTDRYVYYAAWGESVGEESGPGSYDPRQRPWFKAAQGREEVTVSDIYTFNSTGRPGITLSREVRAATQDLIGVVGADITLDGLAFFLDRKKVGHYGRVFLMDEQGRMIAQSKVPGRTATQVGTELVKAEAAEDPVLAAAVSHRLAGDGDRFTFPATGDQRFMAYFHPFIPAANTRWVIGAIAEEEEFTADIKVATLRILLVGAALMFVALLSIHFLARQLTKPLREIAGEAGRIRDFDLDAAFSLRSRIVEVSDLAETIASMKSGLKNFAAYVPKELVRSIISSGRQVTVGGERRRVTIMFSDLKGFTSSSELLEPETVLKELSQYFEALSEEIHRQKGTIDKFIGDAVMAIWNAPQSDPDHAANACRAMLACLRANEKLNADNPNGLLMPMITRFGLHSGDVMVGNVGAADRLQYSVLGASVNLASRIEGLNKVYGTQLLVSETVVAAAGEGFLFRPVDLAAPAGTTNPIALFELMGDSGDNSEKGDVLRRRQAVWVQCYKQYQDRKWGPAAEGFRSYMAEFGGEKLATLYAERCDNFLKEPPPAEWNGVQSFDHK